MELISAYTPDVAFELQSHIERLLVARATDGTLTLTKCAGWVGVPVESSAHFSAANVQSIAASYAHAGHSHVRAIMLESIGDEPVAYEISASANGIQQFNRRFSHFNCALVPGDASSMIVCTTDDFFVVIGTMDFVSRVCGPIEASLNAFHDFACASGLPADWQQSLERIYWVFARDYPAAIPGERLTV